MGTRRASDPRFELLQLSLSLSFFSPVARDWDNDRVWRLSGPGGLASMPLVVREKSVLSRQCTRIPFPVVLDFGPDFTVQ
jgi:hypothetical protein